ncbi:MAG: hypothetical protein ACR2NZ_22905 [Rubripirellula sp.]
MGTWSTALFGDDIACDVRTNYVFYLRDGVSNAAATRQIIADYDDELSDTHEAVVVWCALAVTQWEHGRLLKYVQKKAIQLIDRGGDIERWEAENDSRTVGSRRRVLCAVKKKLERPQPPKKHLPPITKKQLPPKRAVIDHHWTVGQVVAFKRDSNSYVLLLTEQTKDSEYHGQLPFFVVLNWQGKRIPKASRIKNLLPTATVIEVTENTEGEPIPWNRIKKLDTSLGRTRYVHVDENSIGGVFTGASWATLDTELDQAFDPEHQSYLRNIWLDSHIDGMSWDYDDTSDTWVRKKHVPTYYDS